MNKQTIIVAESLYNQAKELFGNQHEIIIADSKPYEQKLFNPKESFTKFRNRAKSKKSLRSKYEWTRTRVN